MAIVKILKLKLFGVNSEKDKLLDTLFKSQLVELKKLEDYDNTSNLVNNLTLTNLQAEQENIVQKINFLEDVISKKEKNYKSSFIKLNVDTLLKIENDGLISVCNDIDSYQNELKNISKELNDLDNKLLKVQPYRELQQPLVKLKNSQNVEMFFGTIPTKNITLLQSFLKNFELTTYKIIGENVLNIIAHKTEAEAVNKELQRLGFVSNDIEYSGSAKELITEIEKHKDILLERKQDIFNRILSLKPAIKELKVYYDKLSFLVEKVKADELIKSTSKAFYLEAFLPSSKREKMEKILNESGLNIEFDFSKPTKSDNPPTILKNIKVVRPFEFVTNMYSPPNYRELDPNGFIMFFFSLFFGFIMADIGYGIILMLIGIISTFKIKKQGDFKNLLQVIGVGGVFTTIFGILFGSFFGLTNAEFSLVPIAVFPNPAEEVLQVLFWCLGAGAVQIMLSLFLKGILLLKRKQVAEAFFSGFIWEFFFIGIGLVILDVSGIVENLKMAGLIMSAISVLISMIGLIFINKGIERVTKGFGSIYNIINIFSDILSYARLFGLMLSGSIIATIVNQLAGGFFSNFFSAIIGVVILLLGHGFNLSMGVLGAYVHVARLQYIEFFSRFYEGEGNLFVPFGNNFKYVYIE